MYLILPTSEAKERNKIEATKRGCNEVDTIYWWTMIDNVDSTQIALNVGDGNGLTKAELKECIDELPKGFIPEL